MRPRLGAFFILVGLVLLVLFVTSIVSKQISGIYLLISIVSIVVGFLLRQNIPTSDSGRFGAVHRMNERNRARRQSRAGGKKDKNEQPKE
jgi:hypothetical protein